MSIRERHGKWHFRFKWQGREYSGATDWDATKSNASKALQEEARFRRQLREGRDPTRIIVVPFEEAAEKFLKWADGEHRAHPNTARRLRTSFASSRIFFNGTAVCSITPGQLESYKTWRSEEHKVREITIRHDLHALSKFFQFGKKHNWVHQNPVEDVDIPGDQDAVREHILTDEEEKAYFAQAARNKNLYDLGRLMILQGPRPEEVMAFRKDDVDLDKSTVRIRGGKSRAARRTLFLVKESQEILKHRLGTSDGSIWLFPSSRFGTAQHITKMIGTHDRVCIDAGVCFCIYDLRHTFATRFYETTHDLVALAAILGHANLQDGAALRSLVGGVQTAGDGEVPRRGGPRQGTR